MKKILKQLIIPLLLIVSSWFLYEHFYKKDILLLYITSNMFSICIFVFNYLVMETTEVNLKELFNKIGLISWFISPIYTLVVILGGLIICPLVSFYNVLTLLSQGNNSLTILIIGVLCLSIIMFATSKLIADIIINLKNNKV